MSNNTQIQGAHNIVIQNVTDSTLTLNVNGEVREIQNQLAELKALLLEHQAQKVQYADKIYNIGHIDEANFGFLTGKKAFNEQLTKSLIERIQPVSMPARRFLELAARYPDWESNATISDKAKEIIAYSFVGVIGKQLSKLMAIGKEDFSEAKQRKYIEKCLDIARRCLDLLGFAMISKLWDSHRVRPRLFSEDEKSALAQRLENAFEPSLAEQFRLLQGLHGLFSKKENALEFPMQELGELAQALQDGSELNQTCLALQALNEKLDKSQYDLLDCFDAEKELAVFLRHFHFLVNYRMASIKQIAYRQIRNDEPHYLHRYSALGIDSKARADAEKINYISDAVHTDAVLLYRGDDYRDNINLFPFVIDYNALTLEHGARICFYRSQSIDDGSLEYLFLEDNSIVHLEKKGILKPDTNLNELLLSDDNQKQLNLDSVVDHFREARQCLLGNGVDFEDF